MFLLSGNFSEFIAATTDTLLFRKECLVLPELKYHMKTPQTAPVHSLTSDLTFQTLINDVTEVKTVAKCIVYIFMPAPQRPSSEEEVICAYTLSFSILIHALVVNSDCSRWDSGRC